VSILTLVGLGVAILSLILTDAFAPRGHGLYVPAHEENGVLIPGHIE